MRLLAKLSSMRLWFGDGRGSSAFNIHIHMLGEGEIDNDDFTCFDKETVRYICR